MSLFKKIKKKLRRAVREGLFAWTDGKAAAIAGTEEKTLVIVKNDFIGDYILFRNFLPYFRQSPLYKDYRIILIGNSTWKHLAEELDKAYYDEMIWIAFDKVFSNLTYRKKTVPSIFSRSFDTLFYPVFSGDPYTEEFFIAKIKARNKVRLTAASPDQVSVHSPFNRLIPTPHQQLFELYRYREMVQLFLQVENAQVQWRPLQTVPVEKNRMPSKPYAVLFPGSSAYLKRWNTSNFLRVAQHLMEVHDLAVVITGSTKDKKYAQAILKGLNADERQQVYDLTGETSLLELAFIIQQAQLLVTNDSVSIHMAASFNTRAVCVFMGENYGRFAPYPAELYPNGVFLVPEEVEQLVQQQQQSDPVHPVFLELDHDPDIHSIPPAAVLQAVDALLKEK